MSFEIYEGDEIDKTTKTQNEREHRVRSSANLAAGVRSGRIKREAEPESGLEVGLESDHGRNTGSSDAILEPSSFHEAALTRRKQAAKQEDLTRANEIRISMGIPAQNQEPKQNMQSGETSEGSVEEVPFLMLSNEEKSRAVSGIVNELKEKGLQIDPGQIDVPKDKEELEFFISSNSRHFSPDRLLQVAISNREYAPNLARDLAKRVDTRNELFDLLDRYKNQPIFEYCVERIENVLSSKELGLLEEKMRSRSADDPKKIDGHEVAMKKEKKTARPLEDYQRILQIDEESLNSLSGNNLLLIGGGFSPIKQSIVEKGVKCRVTNIDPIAEANDDIADETVKKDFLEEPIRQNAFKEIWALHSLPTYAFNPRQVKEFYSRSIHSLEEGGVLRVAPVDKFSDSFSPAMRLNRKLVNKASMDIINIFRQRPDLFSVRDFITENKGAFGKKTEMPGVIIKTIGDKDQIYSFLRDARM